MFISRLLGVLAGALLVGMVAAQDVLLRSDAPTEYVVKKGDTLWDISAMFLEKPWLWPEIWYVNPQVENPHLIYPGDKLYLVWVDGRPMLRRGDGKLSPQVRVEPIDQAIPAIPLEYILPFLNRSRAILTREEIDAAPYIVHFREDRVIGDEGTLAYVRKLDETSPDAYLIFEEGEELRDFETDEILGYHIQHVGNAVKRTPGDPARVYITDSLQAISKGDRLLEDTDANLPREFYPKAPETQVDGHIIYAPETVKMVGQYRTVIIDRGARDGLEPGHILLAYTARKAIDDPTQNVGDCHIYIRRKEGCVDLEPGQKREKVIIPRELSGLVMVYKTFERVSYALVMKEEFPIEVYDEVGSP
ncbi:MAG: LysM domain-containing protein [Gammaproteobacteria bacterium]|nr:LysM domain-containing protein [Gammaproteobacteria bacterium]